MNSFRTPVTSLFSPFEEHLRAPTSAYIVPLSGIQACLGVCDRKVDKGHFGRDVRGRSGSEHLRKQQIPALAPGKEKLQAEAATVFKVRRKLEEM